MTTDYSDGFNYSLTRNNDGHYIVRSILKTSGIENITDKDVLSFYRSFSAFSHVDTGLLPLNGTGVLAIRSAGPHMQITIQHAPGIYYVNWGAYEGQSSAKTYAVAQPYRIVVGDFVNGNLLGARTFYSPYPITHPDMPLYHVNLPNINCKGYRGNGVGWICLYLNQDWSHLPFNEKVSMLIERCSGVETYNDANMSETDGPRFYAAHYRNASEHQHLWDPTSWEAKSMAEGHDWTLNPDLWIPIKVTSLDQQSAHDSNGVPLTLAVALLGNYQAYYTDKEIPKAYNIFAREDLVPRAELIGAYFKKSFAEAPALYAYKGVNNPIAATAQARENKSNIVVPIPQEQEEQEDEFSWSCHCCEEGKTDDDESTSDVNGNSICQTCIEDCYIYIESVGEFYYQSDSNLLYDENTSSWYHTEHDTIELCDNCNYTHAYAGKAKPNNSVPLYITFSHIKEDGTTIDFCKACVDTVFADEGYTVKKCQCGECIWIEELVDKVNFGISFFKYLDPNIEFAEDGTTKVVYTPRTIAACPRCISLSVLPPNFGLDKIPGILELKEIKNTVLCPCGFMTTHDNIVKCSNTMVKDGNVLYEVNSCCIGCVKSNPDGAPSSDSPEYIPGEFQPSIPEAIQLSIQNKIINKSTYVTMNIFSDADQEDSLFSKLTQGTVNYIPFIPPNLHFTD